MAIKSLLLQNVLSFGPEPVRIDLRALNVLIGPNGSGKSNLIEIVGLLKSAPKNLVLEGGGVSEWLWKGTTVPSIYAPTFGVPSATVEVVVDYPHGPKAIRYRLAFSKRERGFELVINDERIENEEALPDFDRPYLYFEYQNGRPMLNVKGETRHLRREDINRQQSVLSQRKDPDQYPEVTYVGQLFDSFQLYRSWEFGPGSAVRDLYGADRRNDFLEEDVDNLGLMLNRLRADPRVKPDLLKYLKMFYEDAEDIATPIQGGLADLRLEEKNNVSIPAIRLSDGTLRWLMLLTVLLHPSPPPLVCIEEPEIGLHPDIIQPLAELLVDASRRMQVIVTTHSDALVEAFTQTPEAVIVCEKENGSTKLKRFRSEDLSSWLERYTLGELWRKGEIGGNRW